MEKYITENQLREQLKISRSSIHRYKTTLGLPYIKVGGKTFYNVDDIKDFFNKHSSHIQKYFNETK